MTKTEELRITVTGPPQQVEQYIHEQHKTAAEGGRYGVRISVERVQVADVDVGFSNEHDGSQER